MIKKNDIQYSAISLRDPVGNVFFAEGRVFRVISHEYMNVALSFLASDLYQELLRREWIVRTWIADDVEKENEVLILEHEKLSFISSALWSFSQWKDAAILTMEVRELCLSMGGDFRDCRPNNIAFKNGHPVMIDFGSFLFKEHVEKQIWEHLYYCTFYRALYHMSYREPFMAHAWGEYASYYFIEGQIAPPQPLEHSAAFRKIYGRVIRCYDVWVRQKYKHFRVYTCIGRWLLQLCNIIARRVLYKEKVWQLFKMQAIFKHPCRKHIEMFRYPYFTDTKLTEIPESRYMIEELRSILKENTDVKSIMLYGVFNIEDISKLQEYYQGKLIVASNDDIYIDKMYLAAKEKKLNISVVRYDIFLEQDAGINEMMKTDLICVQGGKDIYEPITGPVMKFYRLSPLVYTNNETHFLAFAQTNMYADANFKLNHGKLYKIK